MVVIRGLLFFRGTQPTQQIMAKGFVAELRLSPVPYFPVFWGEQALCVFFFLNRKRAKVAARFHTNSNEETL